MEAADGADTILVSDVNGVFTDTAVVGGETTFLSGRDGDDIITGGAGGEGPTAVTRATTN